MSNDVDKKLDDMHILLTIFKEKYVQMNIFNQMIECKDNKN